MYQVNFHDGRIFENINTLTEAVEVADENITYTGLDIDIEEYDPIGEGYPNSVLQRLWNEDTFNDNDDYWNDDPIIMPQGFYGDWS